MNEKTKNVFSFLVRVGLSVFLLKYLFSKIDVARTVEVLKSADMVFIFYASLAFLLIHFLTSTVCP